MKLHQLISLLQKQAARTPDADVVLSILPRVGLLVTATDLEVAPEPYEPNAVGIVGYSDADTSLPEFARRKTS